ncbi:MAG: ribosome silencing factor [Lachnospiraceae bacterium]|nr:ribosome silencing factor [Lachnospiraceae bacterium]
MKTAKELVKIAIDALEDKKAEDIHIIDISEISTLADYFIIANGTNRSQIQALADNVEEALAKAGLPLKQTEGYDAANWILMDYRDIIVHIFDKENRLFYDLDRIWRDGRLIDKKELE